MCKNRCCCCCIQHSPESCIDLWSSVIIFLASGFANGRTSLIVDLQQTVFVARHQQWFQYSEAFESEEALTSSNSKRKRLQQLSDLIVTSPPCHQNSVSLMYVELVQFSTAIPALQVAFSCLSIAKYRKNVRISRHFRLSCYPVRVVRKHGDVVLLA